MEQPIGTSDAIFLNGHELSIGVSRGIVDWVAYRNMYSNLCKYMRIDQRLRLLAYTELESKADVQ